MKKQLFLMTLLATAGIIQAASAELDEFRRLGSVAPARRTNQQKNDYLQGKKEKGESMQTPEFRFALKLEEYYRKLLNEEITILQFIEEISRKVDNYLNNKKDHIHHAKTQEEIVHFLNKYLSMSLEDLQNAVGEKEEDIHQRTLLSRMQRYVDKE